MARSPTSELADRIAKERRRKAALETLESWRAVVAKNPTNDLAAEHLAVIKARYRQLALAAGDTS